jgi:hypothetical protein
VIHSHLELCIDSMDIDQSLLLLLVRNEFWLGLLVLHSKFERGQKSIVNSREVNAREDPSVGM